MSLLTIIQNVCRRVGVDAPNAVISSQDEKIIRMLGAANEEGEALVQEASWQALTNEATFTTAATESQGAMTTLAGTSFAWLKNDTIWDRTQNRPWIPVSDVQWQQMKAASVTGPYVNFRIRGGNMIALPTPTAGHTVAFEWVSKNYCQSSGGTGQSAWAADTDTGVLDETLMTAGVIWRWKQANGLEYGEDFNKWQFRLQQLIAKDGAKPRVSMRGPMFGRGRLLSNLNVPEGSW